MNASDIAACKNKITVVYSPGGGNGKSEIAANLASRFSASGVKSWVLDSNLYAPTQNIIFGFSDYDTAFSDFLIDGAVDEIPVYDIRGLAGGTKGRCYLTPASRNDPDTRHLLQARMQDDDVLDALPEAVLSRMQALDIDVLIIDTHPSFEQINDVWLGITEFLLIVSRMNDIDRENLDILLGDGAISDIGRKLIVFNNVQLDAKQNAIEGMANEILVRMYDREALESTACSPFAPIDDGNACEVYAEPFLYSKVLARYGNEKPREGLFTRRHPNDPFSLSLNRLADYLLSSQHIAGGPSSPERA